MATHNVKHETEILIVGAGPTGLTLACELRRRGVRIRLIEKIDEFPTTSRALGFQARTMEVFDMMGIVDTILAHSTVDVGLSVREANRLIFSAKIHPAPHPDQPYRGIWIQNQAVTESILRAHLATLGDAVERSHELIGFHEVDEVIVATVVNHTTGETEEIRAAYLVGCDGAHSTVRQTLGTQLEGHTYAEHLALADLEMETDLPRDASVFWLNPQGMLAAMPLPESARWRLFAVVEPNAAGDVPQASLEFFQRALVERAGDTTTRLSNPVWLSNFSVHRRLVDHFREGRAFLAGDAAHIHSPAGGQGMNTGIQDAFNLAWKLALAVHGKAGSKLLDTYEEERRPVAQMVLSETDTNFKAAWSQNPVFQFLRDYVLFPILELPGVLDFFIYRGSELNVNYRGSSLAQEYPKVLTHAPRAGDRAPDAHLRIAATNEPTSLLAQFRTTRFTLLLFDDTAHSAAAYEHLVKIAQSVQEKFPDDVQVHVIVSASGPSAMLEGTNIELLDPEHQAHKYYGARGESLYLIRPDGYIGSHGQPADERPLLHYFEEIFHAAHA